MKINSEGGAVQRIYVEALVMGLCIGIAAILLNYWLNDNSWRVRIFALCSVGGALCLLQYWLTRARKL